MIRVRFWGTRGSVHWNNQRESATDRFVKNLASSAARSIGTALVRGLLGSLTRR